VVVVVVAVVAVVVVVVVAVVVVELEQTDQILHCLSSERHLIPGHLMEWHFEVLRIARNS